MDAYACIRTTAELTVNANLVDERPYGQYIRLAPKAIQLNELGMSRVEIAEALGSSVRTVRRAIRWARENGTG